MAVLMTGGSGFIGRSFHKRFHSEQLVNMDLVRPQFHHEATFIQGDIRVENDVRRAVSSKKIKTILSLAAKHHDFGVGHDEYFDTNKDGTKVLCKVASEHEIKEIIFFSSVAVYGLRKEVSTESTPPQPEGAYGASKLAGEDVLKAWAGEDTSRKVLIIRPTLVFGPNNLANMHNLMKQIDSGLYFHLGKADNIKSIAYVENLVEATLYLKDRLKPGVSTYNYADEPQLTTREIGNTIALALNKKIRITIPKFLGVMLGVPFDIAIKLTGKNLPISTARIKKLATETHHSAAKIFSEGFKPPFSTVEGLHKMVEWFIKDKLKA